MNSSATGVEGNLAGTKFVESRYAFLIPEAVTRCTVLFKTPYGASSFTVCGFIIETWGKLLGNSRQSVISRTLIIAAGMMQYV